MQLVQKITVKHNGKLLGKIIQEESICAPAFSVIDCNNLRVFRIIGPPDSNANGLPPDPEFRVVLAHSPSSMDIIHPIISVPTEDNSKNENLPGDDIKIPISNHVDFLDS